MVITAGDLRDAGIAVPLLVGGAALSARFTQTKIAPGYGQAVCYAKDAMTGLRLMNQLMDPADARAGLAGAHWRTAGEHCRSNDNPSGRDAKGYARAESADRCSDSGCAYLERRKFGDVPDLPRCGVTSIRSCCMDGIWDSGNFEKRLAERDAKAVELFESMEEVKREAAEFMKPRAVWQFFEAGGGRQRDAFVCAGRNGASAYV